MRHESKGKNQPIIKAVDFFCGAGGATRGLLDAGIDVVCGIDNDSIVRSTYEENNLRPNGKNVKFIEIDINKLTFEELSQTLQKEKFDKLLFVGCAPCQPFTKINTIKVKRKKETNYILRFADFIEFFKPDYLFIENVPGITAKKYGEILGKLKERLKKFGYYFKDNNINAKKYSIPNNTHRRIILGSLE